MEVWSSFKTETDSTNEVHTIQSQLTAGVTLDEEWFRCKLGEMLGVKTDHFER